MIKRYRLRDEGKNHSPRWNIFDTEADFCIGSCITRKDTKMVISALNNLESVKKAGNS